MFVIRRSKVSFAWESQRLRYCEEDCCSLLGCGKGKPAFQLPAVLGRTPDQQADQHPWLSVPMFEVRSHVKASVLRGGTMLEIAA